jgi:hypothetical protein
VKVVLTERIRGKVSRRRFADLDAALVALERRGYELEAQADGSGRVVGRLELDVKAGVDIRGDGTAVPYTGRIRRREIERVRGESAYDALRRILSA